MDLHALVIDADAEERGVVRNALYKQQWKVCEASSVGEAMRIVGKYPWKLVFCDANLSTQSVNRSCDTTLLSELKGRFGSKLHVVITAQQESSINPFEAILNGASDFFRKPCQEEKVADYSRQVVERLRAAEREVKEAQLTTRLRTSELPPALPELTGEFEAIIKVFRRTGAECATSRACCGSARRPCSSC
jgi:DNA-binding NtrC family response regulator